MKLLHSSLFYALSVAALAAGCASSADKVESGLDPSSKCDDDKVGDDCTCEDGDEEAEGSYECNDDDELECVCAPVDEDDDTEDDSDDEAEPPKDAGKKDAGSADKADATAPTPRPDATIPSFPRPDGGRFPIPGTGDAGEGLPTTPVQTGGADPIVPEIKGECPEFKNGSTIMVAGHRSIEIKVGPANMKGPLVFYWHGTGSSAREVSRFAGNAEVVSMGGIVASFNGNQSAKTGRDCSGTGAHNMSDFEAADQIFACAVKNHGIDPRKVYTTGCSAGGLQAGCMAQKRSSYIAAAAPNSGGVVGNQPWENKGTPAIFTMHGGASDMVIVTFSQTSKTLDTSAKAHGSVVVNCDHGGGHCLAPGPLQQAAWKFMKENPYGVTDSPWKTTIPAGVPASCKVF